MMGSPKRVMRMGSRVRRTLSRTIRHVALNFEIAILRSVLRLQKRADHATVIDYGDNPLRTLQPPSVKVVPAAQVFSRPARVGRDFSANLSEDLRAEVRRGREFFQVTLQCLVWGGDGGKNRARSTCSVWRPTGSRCKRPIGAAAAGPYEKGSADHSAEPCTDCEHLEGALFSGRGGTPWKGRVDERVSPPHSSTAPRCKDQTYPTQP